MPIKVEDDHDVTEARGQSSTETREDTREQTPPDTRVETFDQPRDPPLMVPDTAKSPGAVRAPRRSTRIRQLPSVFRTMCLLKPKDSFKITEFH